MLSKSIVALSLAAAVAPSPSIAEEDDYLRRMSREHAGDVPVAAAAAGDAATESATGEDVVYWEAKGLEGYLALPAGGSPRAGILVIQEWWGLNDNIRTMARRLAEAGYAALAVDLYEGEVATDREEAMALVRRARGNEGRLEENLLAAHRYLTGTLGHDRVGAIGWCFGGGWSLRSAILFGEELDAAVVYYGRTVDDESLESVEAAVLGHFGSEDDGIPLAGVRAFESKMSSLGKAVTIHVYEGADHAFANPSGTRYQADAAELAWKRTLDFFAVHLDR